MELDRNTLRAAIHKQYREQHERVPERKESDKNREEGKDGEMINEDENNDYEFDMLSDNGLENLSGSQSEKENE